jgi:hypothetical protein
VRAARPREAIGNQGQHATGPVVVGIFVGQQPRPTPARIEDLPQAQLREELPRHAQRSPPARIEDFERSLWGQLLGELPLLIVAPEKAFQQRQDGFQGVAPSQIGDDLLLDASLLADRRDNADVFVNGSGRTTDLDGADEHDAVLASLLINACQVIRGEIS